MILFIISVLKGFFARTYVNTLAQYARIKGCKIISVKNEWVNELTITGSGGESKKVISDSSPASRTHTDLSPDSSSGDIGKGMSLIFDT